MEILSNKIQFLLNTAKDYDLNYEEVASLYRKSENISDFYNKLEKYTEDRVYNEY